MNIIFRFIIVLFFILIFALFDLPFLLKRKNKLAIFSYSLLLLLGIAIAYILIQDIGVASPAVYIEKALNFVLMR